MVHKKRPVCADVRSWLLNISERDQHQVIASWSEHIAECVHCRGALMILATDLLGQPASLYSAVTCGVCQRDLAAYTEAVVSQGHRVAAQRYPDVWWHLWTCAECAQTLQGMTTLAVATARGELAQLSVAGAEPPFSMLYKVKLVLPRAMLAHLFKLQLLLGQLRGDDRDEIMLTEGEAQSYSLHVAVSQVQGATCCLSVASDPPTRGRVVLRLGDMIFHADLDVRGVARVYAFPLHLLRDPAGPDLVITLEPPDGSEHWC